MRILFLNPPFKFKISRSSRWPEHTKSGTLYYPFWLAYAAGLAESKGNEINLIDAIARGWDTEQTIAAVREWQPEMVVVDTSTPTINSDVQFVRELKGELPKTWTVLVGPHPSALPEQTMAMSEAIDFIARGEYDWTICELAAAIAAKRRFNNIAGLVWREKKKIIINAARVRYPNLDELPFVAPIYKKFLNSADYRYALSLHPMIQILSSRGCPNMCSFCVVPQTLMGRTFRTRSPENFVAELEWIKTNMPEIKEVFIEDDTFTADKVRAERICDMIIERGLKIVWSANVRADLPANLLQKMKDAGCRILIVGYESGSPEILKNIRKGITIEMAERFTADAKAAGLKIFGCFMIGLPGETKQTIEQTFAFAKRLAPDMAFFQQAVPFPGTEFFAWAKANGYLVTDDWSKWLASDGSLDFLLSYPNLSSADIKAIRDKLMIKFYTSPRQILQTISHNLHPHEVLRVARATKDYISYLLKRRFTK